MLAVGCPIELIMTTRTSLECGRAMALKFMCGLSDVPDAALKSKTHWITPEVEEYLA